MPISCWCHVDPLQTLDFLTCFLKDFASPWGCSLSLFHSTSHANSHCRSLYFRVSGYLCVTGWREMSPGGHRSSALRHIQHGNRQTRTPKPCLLENELSSEQDLPPPQSRAGLGFSTGFKCSPSYPHAAHRASCSAEASGLRRGILAQRRAAHAPSHQPGGSVGTVCRAPLESL